MTISAQWANASQTSVVVTDSSTNITSRVPADTANTDYQQLLAALVPIASYVAPSIIPTTVQVNSTSTPALDGAYSFDSTAQAKLMAVSLYVQVNGKFPANQTRFPWYDATGTPHLFTTTTQFQAFASAIADYDTNLSLGLATAAPIIIP